MARKKGASRIEKETKAKNKNQCLVYIFLRFFFLLHLHDIVNIDSTDLVSISLTLIISLQY